MKVTKYPQKKDWPQLLQRPVFRREQAQNLVRPILREVKENGDTALRRYARQFDQAELTELQVSDDELRQAGGQLSADLKKAIALAIENIRKFHASQMMPVQKIETATGVTCWQKQLPIEKVGLYIPGGSAPLFSTLLMLAVPAQIAGCREIVVCTPPDKNGAVPAAIRYCANILGLDQVFAVGGAQAIAAMACGTESIPAVYKIFGPGNQYVTAAKQLVSMEGVAIDMPAGPSEVAVLADDAARADFAAGDLLSQAEHGPDSQVILVTDSETLIGRVEAEIEKQLALLPRAEIARQALAHSGAFLVSSIEQGMELVNAYAPEHLILNLKDARQWAGRVMNAGSVFVGPYSPEPAGDYASGTNHTLPTNGYARNYSGLSLGSFMKTITFQELSARGLREVGPAVETMAAAEGLQAHRNAVSLRLAAIKKGNT